MTNITGSVFFFLSLRTTVAASTTFPHLGMSKCHPSISHHPSAIVTTSLWALSFRLSTILSGQRYLMATFRSSQIDLFIQSFIKFPFDLHAWLASHYMRLLARYRTHWRNAIYQLKSKLLEMQIDQAKRPIFALYILIYIFDLGYYIEF